MRVLTITGDHPRHKAYLAAISKYSPIAGQIICAREEFIPKPPEGLSSYLKDLWHWHFSARAEAEEEFFGDPGPINLAGVRHHVLEIPAEDLNDPSTLDWYNSTGPYDVALVLGVPIIKDPLFSALPAYTINLHLGLIPEYKGSITAFWPFYFLEPQMFGMSYHILDRLVDTGEVLHQTPAELVRGDGMHACVCRTSMKAYEEVGLVLKHVELSHNLGVIPLPFPENQRRGKLFKKADWHPEMLNVIYGLYGDRIVDNYLRGDTDSGRRPKLIRIDPAGPGCYASSIA